jgi:hypothetical protein
VHLYCYPWPDPCVTVYSAVTRPSGGLGCWAGQGLLDTVWTRPTRAGAFSPREGGHGGFRGAAYRRCSAAEEEKDEALKFIMDIMSKPPKWAPDLPITCEGGYADNYGDC